jgi:hypothetical protein
VNFNDPRGLQQAPADWREYLEDDGWSSLAGYHEAIHYAMWGPGGEGIKPWWAALPVGLIGPVPIGDASDPTPADLARQQMQLVKPVALAALAKRECAGLFGSGKADPSKILETMIANTFYRDVGTDYVAKYNGATGSVTINTHTGPEGTYWNTSWNLQTIENAVTLLHEVGHATSSNRRNRFLNDTSLLGRSNPVRSWENDSLIWKNCFGRENPFPPGVR